MKYSELIRVHSHSQETYKEIAKTLPRDIPERISHTITAMMHEIAAFYCSCEVDELPIPVAVEAIKNITSNVVLNSVRLLARQDHVRSCLMDFVQHMIDTLAELEKEAGW